MIKCSEVKNKIFESNKSKLKIHERKKNAAPLDVILLPPFD